MCHQLLQDIDDSAVSADETFSVFTLFWYSSFANVVYKDSELNRNRIH